LVPLLLLYPDYEAGMFFQPGSWKDVYSTHPGGPQDRDSKHLELVAPSHIELLRGEKVSPNSTSHLAVAVVLPLSQSPPPHKTSDSSSGKVRGRGTLHEERSLENSRQQEGKPAWPVTVLHTLRVILCNPSSNPGGREDHSQVTQLRSSSVTLRIWQPDSRIYDFESRARILGFTSILPSVNLIFLLSFPLSFLPSFHSSRIYLYQTPDGQ
jgi:hypothetical protein